MGGCIWKVVKDKPQLVAEGGGGGGLHRRWLKNRNRSQLVKTDLSLRPQLGGHIAVGVR